MISSLTADDLFAYVLFMRTVDNRTLLLVEGETDCAILDSHLTDYCETIPAGGKSVAVGAALLAHEEQLPGVLALVDRDWVGVLDEAVAAPNVFYTDGYDMESTLFLMDDVLARILNAYCRRDALRSADSDRGARPAEVATKAATAVAAFRYAARTNGWSISVRDFPVHTIANVDGGRADLRLLCKIARSKSGASADVEELCRATEEAYAAIGEDPSKCSGHDLINALSFVINRKFGGSISDANLASAFRAAVGCRDLSGTRFFQSISIWVSGQGVRRVWECDGGEGSTVAVPAARKSSDRYVSGGDYEGMAER